MPVFSAGDRTNVIASAESGGGRLRILVGDSQRLFAQAVAGALARRSDMEIVEEHPQSGTGAVQAALTHRPDIALLHCWLEGVTAAGASHSLVAGAPDVRVVVLAWSYERAHVQQALTAGAAAFVSKDVPLAELVTVLHRVAAGERVVADPNHPLDAETEAASPTADPHDPKEALTMRELEVLRLLGDGLPPEDIAASLGVARETVRTHMTTILAKTNTSSQLQAVLFARKRGYLG